MKRFNCEEAGCAICTNAKEVKGIFGVKKYKCSKYEKEHKNIKAKDCLAFRCNSLERTDNCRRCRKGEKRR